MKRQPAYGPAKSTSRPAVHVAVAVVRDAIGRVALARRPENVHQGGLWEFPGGKVEAGESVLQALRREIHEELGIAIETLRPLIRVPHAYPDKTVLLDVWDVISYAGAVHGREGQPVVWAGPDRLAELPLPEANQPIVTAVRLPGLYLITPEPDEERGSFLARLERMLQAGVRLVQLRAKALAGSAYVDLAREVLRLARAHGAGVLLNAEPELARALGAGGVHLSSRRLMAAKTRPMDNASWVAASCHDRQQLNHACRIGVDFVVVSPVLATRSHPDARALGWDAFRALTEPATVPVFALGGMDCGHVGMSYRHGGQGIAALSGLWGAAQPERQVGECLDRTAGSVNI